MKRIALYLSVIIVSCFFLSSTSYSELLGCYKKNNGQLRVVNDFSDCLKSEEPVIISDSGNTGSGEYAGEVCLGMTDYENALRFRMGLFHMGDIYYSLSGFQMDEYGGKDALSGSAVMVDDHLEMVVTIVRTSTDESGLDYLSSQLGQIKWDEVSEQYILSMIDTKQYVDDPDHEHIGDEYSYLVEIDCPTEEVLQ